jgi:rubrerythrin
MSRDIRVAAVSATLQQLMIRAVLMEIEAAERYEEFADTMQTHNSPEVAAMFRRLSVIERRHADQLMAQMGWSELPESGVLHFDWEAADSPESLEAPETVPADALHYLMRPFHVLQLALDCEERAYRFFDQVAATATDEAVVRTALEMRDEESEHIALIQTWMERVARPDEGWSVDPDPPRYID